jgi:hypothetical protein
MRAHCGAKSRSPGALQRAHRRGAAGLRGQQPNPLGQQASCLTERHDGQASHEAVAIGAVRGKFLVVRLERNWPTCICPSMAGARADQ